MLSWDATSIARWLQRSLIRKLACLYREQMQSSTVLHRVLETELAASTVSQRALSGEQSAAVLAAVQSKHDFRCLKQNSIYKEYSSSGRVASRPASGRRPAKSDGRMCVTLCVEDAASQQQRPQTGVWCPVSGTPYTSLGQIQHLELKLPVLYRDQAEAARAAKYVIIHHCLCVGPSSLYSCFFSAPCSFSLVLALQSASYAHAAGSCRRAACSCCKAFGGTPQWCTI